MKKKVGFLSVLFWLLSVATGWATGLEIRDPWVREAPPGAQALAAYMVMHNTGTVGKTVVGANTPLFARVEFHETLHQGGVATMVARDSLVVDAGGQVVLKPGGYHMMLLAPVKPLKAGDRVPLLLQLSDGSRVAVEAEVRVATTAGESKHVH
ncbi:MAG: copper chaperone PCu(A)C [Magnetococcus sp. MYC-9]